MTAAVTTTAVATLERLRAAQAIAVVRARDGEEAVAIADALAAGGLEAIELTFTTPGVDQALVEVRERLGATLLLGAGTITTAEQARAAAAAGADFLVSPHLDPALLEAMLATGLLAVPGVLTPSEVAAALRAGAIVVKLFPASTVGVGHLKVLYGPFPGLQVVPTGGISVATAGEWLPAGGGVAVVTAAIAAGALLDIPVLAWTLPQQTADALNAELGTGFHGRPGNEIDLVVTVDRSRQLRAVHAHPSQAVPGAPLWRRLDLLGNLEHLRWLHPARRPQQVELQFTADCPNWPTTYAHLVSALHDLGRDQDDICMTLVHDEAQAQVLQFTGSPTVIVDGVDPFADPHVTAALACRLYDTPDGRRGTPTLAQVTAALATHQP